MATLTGAGRTGTDHEVDFGFDFDRSRLRADCGCARAWRDLPAQIGRVFPHFVPYTLSSDSINCAISEAIAMTDRVLILTNRPASLLKTVDIKSRDTLSTQKYFDEIREVLK